MFGGHFTIFYFETFEDLTPGLARFLINQHMNNEPGRVYTKVNPNIRRKPLVNPFHFLLQNSTILLLYQIV